MSGKEYDETVIDDNVSSSIKDRRVAITAKFAKDTLVLGYPLLGPTMPASPTSCDGVW